MTHKYKFKDTDIFGYTLFENGGKFERDFARNSKNKTYCIQIKCLKTEMGAIMKETKEQHIRYLKNCIKAKQEEADLAIENLIRFLEENKQ